MGNDKDALHALLLRQLKRNLIDLSCLAPEKKTQWNSFLLSISRAYQNFEQDLYLLERSMILSSDELKAVNEKLESAQQIAHLGYWRYDNDTGQLTWSKEMFELTGFDPVNGAPKFKDLLEQIQKDYQEKLLNLMKQSMSNGHEFSMELQFKNKKNNQYYWQYYKGHPEAAAVDDKSNVLFRFLTGIVIDISAQKQNDLDKDKANQQLLTVSRQAGMAEVATSILHNVGNILNSANVSMDIIRENMAQPYYKKWSDILTMLKKHQQTLVDYLTKDKTGQLIPDYLIELGQIISNNHQQNTAELANLHKNITHIKNIVSMQKTISGTSGIVEQVFIPELIESALQLTNGLVKTDLIIRKTFEKIPFIYTDKSKVLQIIINIIQNAKDAVLYNDKEVSKEIEIIIKNIPDKIQILIIDNGLGIPNKNLNLIFSFGFSTKKEGHGFGLHASALSAKELGGTLIATSKGVGCGATFSLTLPIKAGVI